MSEKTFHADINLLSSQFMRYKFQERILLFLNLFRIKKNFRKDGCFVQRIGLSDIKAQSKTHSFFISEDDRKDCD